MMQERKIRYKLFYYFLAVIPQCIAILFGLSITLNLASLLLKTDDTNPAYLLAIGLALCWIILFNLLQAKGVFARFGIDAVRFQEDIFRIAGYSALIGVLAGVIGSFI